MHICSPRFKQLLTGVTLLSLMLLSTACTRIQYRPAQLDKPTELLIPRSGPADLQHGATTGQLAQWGLGWQIAAQRCEADKASIGVWFDAWNKAAESTQAQ